MWRRIYSAKFPANENGRRKKNEVTVIPAEQWFSRHQGGCATPTNSGRMNSALQAWHRRRLGEQDVAPAGRSRLRAGMTDIEWPERVWNVAPNLFGQISGQRKWSPKKNEVTVIPAEQLFSRHQGD